MGQDLKGANTLSSYEFQDRLDAHHPVGFEAGLRPSQEFVLRSFIESHQETADLGIELPTGEGKTLIGLLLADWALDQGMSVAYLTGNKHLAQQVRDQSLLFHDLKAHIFEGRNYPGSALDDYHQAQAIGVMNYWVYFNSHPVVNPADFIVLDDAHMAEQSLSGLFTVRIPRAAEDDGDLYRSICDLVLQRTRNSYLSLQALRDGVAPWACPPELISFDDWFEVSSAASEMIRASAVFSRDRSLNLTFQALQPKINRCGVLIGPTQIEIRPYILPTQSVPSYSSSSRRIYMSATLGRPGDLERRLGVKPITILRTDRNLMTATAGRRVLLLNPSLDQPFGTNPMRFAFNQMSSARSDGEGRCAWLCSSNPEAEYLTRELRARGHEVFRLQAGDETPFDQWMATRNACLVTAGRFDGLDMADEVCRLVILPTVPAASSEFERFAVAYLGDASFMKHRVGQRITQALGRANRSSEDSGLYIGLDPSFAVTLADSVIRAGIAEELEPVVRTALENHEPGNWNKVDVAARAFWSTHRIRQGVAEGEYPSRRPGRAGRAQSSVESAGFEVDALNKYWLGDYSAAQISAARAADCLRSQNELEHAAFWKYVEAHIAFEATADGNHNESLRAITESIATAPNTAWFIRLRRTAETLAGRSVDVTSNDPLFLAWDRWIREVGGRSQTIVATARSQLHGTHDQRAEALVVLGRLCGAEAERPRGQSATDVRWNWMARDGGHVALLEVKTGEHEAVPRDWVNQLLGQMSEENQRSSRAKVSGCIVADSTSVSPPASVAAASGIAFLHTESVVALFDLAAGLFTQYASVFGAGTPQERGAARDSVETRIPRGNWLARCLSESNRRVIRGSEMNTRVGTVEGTRD